MFDFLKDLLPKRQPEGNKERVQLYQEIDPNRSTRHDLIRVETNYLGNVYVYKKGSFRPLTENFQAYEFDCKCSFCNETKIAAYHIHELQKFRNELARPIFITSAYRCPHHNKAVGGVKRSRHLIGDATDIVVPGMHPKIVQSEAVNFFDGLGHYRTFTHVDSRGYQAQW